jgi:hypothetical protein
MIYLSKPCVTVTDNFCVDPRTAGVTNVPSVHPCGARLQRGKKFS